MKHVLVVTGTAVVLIVGMAAWSVAGKLMTTKDDMSVVMGVVLVAALVGTAAAGVTAVVRKIFKGMADSAKKEGR